MTSTSVEPTPPAPIEPPAPVDPPAAGDDDKTGKPSRSREGNAEAARYRSERNEARAEVVAANEKVANLQRSIVEYRIQHDVDLPFLHNPADLFDVAGVTLDDLLDDDRMIDEDRLIEALEGVKASRPYLLGSRPAPVDQLYAAMQRQLPRSPESGTNWQKAIKTQPS